ncbi:MAG: hypothetical protein DME06_04310, partial [Candidatus Rokuibacteriota bacterium]
MRSVVAALAALLLVALVVPRTAPAAGGKVTVAHGLSMYGDLKYGPGFTHFEYTAPAPPKGGAVKLAALGTFDSLNPFILKGVAAAGIAELFDTLMVQSADEPFSEYGLLAEAVEVPEDRSWVAYTL